MSQPTNTYEDNYTGEEWHSPFGVCAVHFRNCSDECLVGGRSRLQIGPLVGVVQQGLVDVGEKGAAQLLVGTVQGWIVKLATPLENDLAFGASWFNEDGDEFIAIGTDRKCGEYTGDGTGVSAPAGSNCIKVIGSCCTSGGTSVGPQDPRCLSFDISGETGDCLTSLSWSGFSWSGQIDTTAADFTTQLTAALITAGLPNDIVVTFDGTELQIKSASTDLVPSGTTEINFTRGSCVSPPPPQLQATADIGTPVTAGSPATIDLLANDTNSGTAPISVTQVNGSARTVDTPFPITADDGTTAGTAAISAAGVLTVLTGSTAATFSGTYEITNGDGATTDSTWSQEFTAASSACAVELGTPVLTKSVGIWSIPITAVNGTPAFAITSDGTQVSPTLTYRDAGGNTVTEPVVGGSVAVFTGDYRATSGDTNDLSLTMGPNCPATVLPCCAFKDHVAANGGVPFLLEVIDLSDSDPADNGTQTTDPGIYEFRAPNGLAVGTFSGTATGDNPPWYDIQSENSIIFHGRGTTFPWGNAAAVTQDAPVYTGPCGEDMKLRHEFADADYRAASVTHTGSALNMVQDSLASPDIDYGSTSFPNYVATSLAADTNDTNHFTYFEISQDGKGAGSATLDYSITDMDAGQLADDSVYRIRLMEWCEPMTKNPDGTFTDTNGNTVPAAEVTIA